MYMYHTQRMDYISYILCRTGSNKIYFSQNYSLRQFVRVPVLLDQARGVPVKPAMVWDANTAPI
jgi:hypothetical protein